MSFPFVDTQHAVYAISSEKENIGEWFWRPTVCGIEEWEAILCPFPAPGNVAMHMAVGATVALAQRYRMINRVCLNCPLSPTVGNKVNVCAVPSNGCARDELDSALQHIRYAELPSTCRWVHVCMSQCGTPISFMHLV